MQCNRSFIHFVWGRGWLGTHTLLSPVLGLGSCTPGTRTSWMSPLVPKTSEVAARQPRSLVCSFQLRNSAWLFPQPLSPLGLYCCLSLSERLGHPAGGEKLSFLQANLTAGSNRKEGSRQGGLPSWAVWCGVGARSAAEVGGLLFSKRMLWGTRWRTFPPSPWGRDKQQ